MYMLFDNIKTHDNELRVFVLNYKILVVEGKKYINGKQGFALEAPACHRRLALAFTPLEELTFFIHVQGQVLDT